MRYVVGVLTILGALVCGYFGNYFLIRCDLTKQIVDGNLENWAKRKESTPQHIEAERARQYAALRDRRNGAYAMLAALPLGLAGAVLVFMHKGLIASPLIVAACD